MSVTNEVEVDEIWTDGRPQPEIDGVSQPYWEATARGELLFQQCSACDHRQFYPRPLCVRCGGEPEWRRAAGAGVVHTFTVIRANGVEPFKDWLPYVVAIVELDEGPRMMGNVVGGPVEDVHVGMRVKVDFVPLNDHCSLPFWRREEA